ncbi:hypothetical protein BDR06DRAFT_503140 [Suillus hirtellus]|nr:hypothetical protein BDR06DRAFT_503140 [Suillus hirtellus]
MQLIQDSDQTSSGPVAQDYVAILDCVLRETGHALRRNHMENVLNNDYSIFTPLQTVQRHPELCKIIHNACQTGCFSTMSDIKILHLPNTSSPVSANSGFTQGVGVADKCGAFLLHNFPHLQIRYIVYPYHIFKTVHHIMIVPISSDNGSYQRSTSNIIAVAHFFYAYLS